MFLKFPNALRIVISAAPYTPLDERSHGYVPITCASSGNYPGLLEKRTKRIIEVYSHYSFLNPTNPCEHFTLIQRFLVSANISLL